MPSGYEILKHEVDAYFDRINPDGSYTPILDRPVEGQVLIFGREEGETRTVLSKGIGRYNQPIDTDQDPSATSMQFTALEFPDDFKALAFAGEITVTEEAGANITNEVHDDVLGPGQIIKLAHGNVSAVVVRDDTTPTPTTFVAGTDYAVDVASFGVIKLLEGGAIAAGTNLRIDYTYAATVVKQIVGGVKPQQRMRMRALLKNRPNGRYAFIEVFDWRAGTSGETDLMSEEALQLPLSGLLTVPPGRPGPYVYEERLTPA